MSVALVQNLLKEPDNAVCADCKKKAAKWASTNLGIFICIDCSGIHRSLGTHISFVRSCTLDQWTSDQARFMACVGNATANEYWEAKLPDDFNRPDPVNKYEMINFIKAKYVAKKWAADGPPPGLKEEEIEESAPTPVKHRKHREHAQRTVKPSKSADAFDLSAPARSDEVTLNDIFGSGAPSGPAHTRVARRNDGVSSSERKAGRKLPARLARKVKGNEAPARPAPTRKHVPSSSAPNLAELDTKNEESSDSDPFA